MSMYIYLLTTYREMHYLMRNTFIQIHICIIRVYINIKYIDMSMIKYLYVINMYRINIYIYKYIYRYICVTQRGSTLYIISSPYGLLSTRIFPNSVARGVLSNFIQLSDSTLESRFEKLLNPRYQTLQKTV